MVYFPRFSFELEEVQAYTRLVPLGHSPPASHIKLILLSVEIFEYKCNVQNQKFIQGLQIKNISLVQ